MDDGMIVLQLAVSEAIELETLLENNQQDEDTLAGILARLTELLDEVEPE
jgi:hypothetical protein